MSGMGFMLQQILGISPEELRNKFDDASATLRSGLETFDARLTAIETTCREILDILKKADEHDGNQLEPVDRTDAGNWPGYGHGGNVGKFDE